MVDFPKSHAVDIQPRIQLSFKEAKAELRFACDVFHVWLATRFTSKSFVKGKMIACID